MKKIICIMLAAVLALSFCSCGSEPVGKGGDFVYYLDSTIRSLDPQTANGRDSSTVLNAIFEGLCRLDSDGNAIAGVAESWDSNSDSTQFTFNLRDDSQWSNGDPVTAYDFVFAIQRALSPDTKATNIDDLFVIRGARDMYDGLIDSSQLGVTAANNTTLIFILETSSPNFPQLTAGPRFMPCNEAFFTSTGGRYGLSADYLIGNGPFTFSSSSAWTDGGTISLSYSENYHGENTVKPTSLTFYMGGLPETDPIASLTDGTSDILKIDESLAAEAENSGCTVYSFSNQTTGLIFNTDNSTMSSASLRELFVKTIDRQNLLNALPENYGEATDIIPSGLKFGGSDYRSAVGSSLYVKQDDSIIDKLDKIVDSVEGDAIPSVTIICKNDDISTAVVNSIISSWNSKVGSYFNILPLTDSEYESRIYNRDYQIALYTVESSGESVYSMMNCFESTASPLLLNSSAYDTLLHADNSTVQDFSGLEKFINNQYIFYPVMSEKSYYAVSPNISGLILGIGRIDFIYAVKK